MTPASITQRQIVVLSDTAVVRSAVHDLLVEAGYAVSSRPLCAATNASLSLSLQQMAEERPDLIVHDLPAFAERHGWQLLEALKLSRETNHLPVILSTTAAGMVADLSAHLTRMRVGAVLKPVDPQQLLATVSHMLSQEAVGTDKRTVT